MSFEDFEVNMLISLISVQGQHIDPLNIKFKYCTKMKFLHVYEYQNFYTSIPNLLICKSLVIIHVNIFKTNIGYIIIKTGLNNHLPE